MGFQFPKNGSRSLSLITSLVNKTKVTFDSLNSRILNLNTSSLKSVIILSITILCFFDITLAQPSSVSNFEIGSKLYQEGKYKQAIVEYRQAIKNDDRSVFSRFNLGHCFVQLKNYPLAIVNYKRAIELQPSWSPPYAMLGDLYFVTGNYPEALTFYAHASELGEEGRHISLARAESALKIGAHTEALKHFEAALKFDPEDVQIYFAITEIYENSKQYLEARETLETALKLAPASGAELYFYLASLYQKQSMLKMAISTIESGLALSPKRHDMRRYLSQMYVEIQKPWMSVFILEEGLDRNGPSSLAMDLAEIYMNQKRFEEALSAYKRAWKLKDWRARRGIRNVAASFQNIGNQEKSKIIIAWLEQQKRF